MTGTRIGAALRPPSTWTIAPAEDPAAAAFCPRCNAAPCRCPDCHGAGWLRVPGGTPTMCACRRGEVEQRRDALRRDASNLRAIAHLTFDAFDPAVPGVATAYQAARTYARDPRGWLVLGGPTGTGKTHLAAAAANELLGRGRGVVFQVVPTLLDHFRAAFKPSSEVEFDDVFEAVRSAEVLVLDDFGAEKASEWATERLFLLIDHRYLHRLPTVVTTNLSLPEFKNRRVADRLFDTALSTVVTLTGQSYRQLPAKRRKVVQLDEFRGEGPR